MSEMMIEVKRAINRASQEGQGQGCTYAKAVAGQLVTNTSRN